MLHKGCACARPFFIAHFCVLISWSCVLLSSIKKAVRVVATHTASGVDIEPLCVVRGGDELSIIRR